MLFDNKINNPERGYTQFEVEVLDILSPEMVDIDKYYDLYFSSATVEHRRKSPKECYFKSKEELARCFEDTRIQKVIIKSGGDIERILFLTADPSTFTDYTPSKLLVKDVDNQGDIVSTFWENSSDFGPSHYDLLLYHEMWRENSASILPFPPVSEIKRGRYREGPLGMPMKIPLSTINEEEAAEIQEVIDSGGLYYLLGDLNLSSVEVDSKKPISGFDTFTPGIEALKNINGIDRIVISYEYPEGEESIVGSIPNILDRHSLINDSEVSVQDYFAVEGIRRLTSFSNDKLEFINLTNERLSFQKIETSQLSANEKLVLVDTLYAIEKEGFDYVGDPSERATSYHKEPSVKRSIQDQRWNKEDLEFILDCDPEDVFLFTFEQEGTVCGYGVLLTSKGLRNDEVREALCSFNPNCMTSDEINQTIYIANLVISRNARGLGTSNSKELLSFAINSVTGDNINILAADTGEKLGNSRLKTMMTTPEKLGGMGMKLKYNHQHKYAAVLI